MSEILEIPIDSEEASFKIRTSLEEKNLVLRFDWNDRSERFAISILDEDEDPIVMGMTLSINLELIARFEDDRLPPGLLMLYDSSDKNLECGREDLGKRCVLLYQTSF